MLTSVFRKVVDGRKQIRITHQHYSESHQRIAHLVSPYEDHSARHIPALEGDCEIIRITPDPIMRSSKREGV